MLATRSMCFASYLLLNPRLIEVSTLLYRDLILLVSGRVVSVEDNYLYKVCERHQH